MKYRTDIDGLRSIAVVLVILHHLGLHTFSGGFIGVDVFFVISGYLITSIIYTSLQNDSFDFADFYIRRIKRLMPVLYAVVLTTLITYSFFMLPGDLVKLYTGAIWVIYYVGNFYFWREHGGYFGGDAQEAPLLHTWSLAVEEQYYLIWPLMLYFLYTWLGRKKLLLLTLGILIVSLLVSELGTRMTIGAAYYLLPTRFVELMIGAGLALIWTSLPVLGSYSRHCISLVGLSFIIGPALLFSAGTPFPGTNVLLPTLGAAMLIYSQTGIVNRILGIQPFVFIGKISYSLYLWHWPIVVMVLYRGQEMSPVMMILVVAIMLLLSYLSWRYVEQPFRHFSHKSFFDVMKKAVIYPGVLLTVLATIGIFYNGYPWRFAPELEAMEKVFQSRPEVWRDGCHVALRNSDILPTIECEFGNKAAEKPSVFVLGDSHANHFVPFIDAIADDAGLSAIDYTMDQCLPLFNLSWGANAFKASKCKERNNQAKRYLSENKFEYVVLAGSWPTAAATRKVFSPQRLTEPLEVSQTLYNSLYETVLFLTKQGSKVILVEDTSDLGGVDPKCPLKRLAFGYPETCQFRNQTGAYMNKMFEDVQKEFVNVTIIKPKNAYCNLTECKMELNGVPLYRDNDHLSQDASRYLGNLYLKTHGNPITASD